MPSPWRRAAPRWWSTTSGAGGEAFADGASVTDEAGVARMVAETLARWGRVDILIANAGVLRDKSFSKMELADFRAVVDVHLMGSVVCAKAVWEAMRAQGYGRIVLTTSSTGLYGNFGQANYGAAKLALVGLMNTLKLEGQKTDIRVNAISPVAATRMTEALMPPDMLQLLRPELVTPGVVYLASDDAPNGAILAAGAGGFAVARIYETEGVHLADASPEGVRDAWAAIADPAGQRAYVAGPEQTQKFVTKALAE
jgi:NAD(P)-dependent dehydrogenase (short-subunit alcohol dehydrogenase family)